MAGKYDPPDKARLLAENPHIGSVCELMVAAAEAKFPPKAKSNDGASRATPTENTAAAPKRGRKPVVTPERVQLICEMLALGETECAACLRAGIGLTAWNAAKRKSAELRQRIALARDDWARLRAKQHAAALYASQATREATRKALKPRPIRQAQLVVWHLTSRVPLNVIAIPETEIASACERFNLSLDTWQRQEHAFGLLQKVYAKRAAIRGQQQQQQAPPSRYWTSGFEDLEDGDY
jgi:hypothetical protein